MKKLLIFAILLNIIAFNIKTVEAQNKTEKKTFTLPLSADTVMLFGSQDIAVTNLSIDITMTGMDSTATISLYHGQERAAATHKPMIDGTGTAITQTLTPTVAKYLIYSEYYEGTFGHMNVQSTDTTGTITAIITYQ